MNIKENILGTVGATPLVKINNLNRSDANILAKVEFFNPGGSAKDRVGAAMIDAAVKAGLIGAPAVMIGALSGIGLFTMPNNTLLLSLLRLALTLIGGIMGILGVILSIMAILLYVVSLQSYNTPFLAPYSPSISADKQDAVAQKPLTKWTTRPQSLPNKNKKRRG